MHTPDFTDENILSLAKLFPNCVTESKDEAGRIRRSIDFDLLRQELSPNIVEGPKERYHLNWPGKKQALLAANAPIAKTLRPCREESVEFDTTENIFIEGDNLDALKLLQETYLGKVKMIYIDPPYNTGKDFIYSDRFAKNSEDYLLESGQKDEEGNRLVANTEANGRFHSDWLSMMYSRLKLARNLLRDDGVIFISIDDGEVDNIRKVSGEIFGDNNFIATFIWEKRKTRENRRVFSFNHDFILCFAKNKVLFEDVRNLLPPTEDVHKRYSNPDNDARGDWQSVSLNAQAGHATPSQFYEIKTPGGRKLSPPTGRCWSVTQDKFLKLVSDNRIWFGKDGNNAPRVKSFKSEANLGLTPHTLWTAAEVGTTDTAKKSLISLFNEISVFDTPKPVGLIQRMIQVATKSDDVVLDFFAGTSPVAHATMQLNAEDNGNRKFIMVQLPEACDEKSEAFKAGYKTIAEISKERIRRAGVKIKKENPDAAENLDTGFRVFKIDSSNMADVFYTPDKLDQELLPLTMENIKTDRSAEDLLFQVLLDWGVDLCLPIEKEQILDRDVLFVDSNSLAACFETKGRVTEELCKELAKRRPLRVVFRDSGFKDDSVKINVTQIFTLMSPETEVKTI